MDENESWVVSADESDMRVDLFLVRRAPGVSRAQAKQLVERGALRVNARRVRKGDRLREGDRVTLHERPAPRDFVPRPKPDLPLSVIHADDALIVLDKPAGLPCHPLREDEEDTISNALIARYPELARVGHAHREPGLVHRLDTWTSGLLLVARSQVAFERLREDLREGLIDKLYLAVVEGPISAPLAIDAPIASKRGDRRVAVCLTERDAISSHAQPALTEVLDSERHGTLSLVRVRARSARRHQIRAHLAALGFPLVGDVLYGGQTHSTDDSRGGRDTRPGRHLLHAHRIALRHPTTGEPSAWELPPPADFRAVLDRADRGG